MRNISPTSSTSALSTVGLTLACLSISDRCSSQLRTESGSNVVLFAAGCCLVSHVHPVSVRLTYFSNSLATTSSATGRLLFHFRTANIMIRPCGVVAPRQHTAGSIRLKNHWIGSDDAHIDICMLSTVLPQYRNSGDRTTAHRNIDGSKWAEYVWNLLGSPLSVLPVR